MALGRSIVLARRFAPKNQDAAPPDRVLDGRARSRYATLDDVIDLAEALVVSVVRRVLERRQRELKALDRDTSKLENVRAPFPRLSYDEAADIEEEGPAVRVGRRFRRSG